MKIFRLQTPEGVFYFEPRGKQVEPCACLLAQDGRAQKIGAAWLDFSNLDGTIHPDELTSPPWSLVAAVKVAQDTLRGIDQAGPGCVQVAQLLQVAPDFYLSKIDGRRAKVHQCARDTAILLLLARWEKRETSWAARAAELAHYGIIWDKDGDRNWRRLHDRVGELRKTFQK